MPTVVIDAGIATEENLNLIRSKKLHYICVDRRRVRELPEEEPEVIYEKDDTLIKAVRVNESDEVFLYCISNGRAEKESSIKEKFQSRFEEELSKLRDSLGRKGGVKKYEKVIERIGRLKERYGRVAHFYDIAVKEKEGKAVEISWKIKDSEKFETSFSGVYCLRSSRKDLSDEELWSIYNMLSRVEASFRSLKSELSIRPIYHRIDRRIRGHVFTTLLAYHLLCVIQKTLHSQGIHYSWKTIRNFMKSHVRVTTTMTTRNNKTIYVRLASQPEEFH
ncbi:MAG: IS1634 family transposase, partial [Thermodesulforhabdaceae bacterium]